MACIGSDSVQTSKENTELVTYLGKNGDYKEPDKLKTLSFTCKQDCHVKINESDNIFVPENATLDFDSNDEKIYSFVIVEPGIEYLWMGTV